MTVTASGKILKKPMLIFKGAQNGRIGQHEFPNYENDMICYLCQQNAWMDEEAMIVWVEQVLCPHIETAPAGILPYFVSGFIPLSHDGVSSRYDSRFRS
jgi:hypothetical protein